MPKDDNKKKIPDIIVGPAVLFGIIGLIIALFHPHTRYVHIEGTAPPGAQLRFDSSFRVTATPRGHTSYDREIEHAAVTQADDSGRYSVDVACYRRALIPVVYAILFQQTDDNRAHIAVSMKAPPRHRHFEEAQPWRHAAVLWTNGNRFDVNATLTCEYSYRRDAWYCEPRGFFADSGGSVSLFPKADPFVLDIVVKESTTPRERIEYFNREFER